MPIHILVLPAAEAVRLLRSETIAAERQPELNVCASKEYIIQERGDLDLVTELSTLSIEPRLERGYWVLKITVERALGPLAPRNEDALARRELNVDEFEAEMNAPGRKRILVRLETETAAAKRHFDAWLAEMRARHPVERRRSRRTDRANNRAISRPHRASNASPSRLPTR
jgi:hypothetical protein